MRVLGTLGNLEWGTVVLFQFCDKEEILNRKAE